MATLLRDVISIPERVGTGDFVFKLAESLNDPQATVDSYVVTDQLVVAFRQALDIVRAAVTGASSKAAYLDSSFGGGKSHFMAMLRLLLESNPTARAVPELAGVVADNAGWIEGKRFLTPTFHLIGSNSLEDAVLGGYVRYLQRVHPDAPLPDVFVDAPILANAEALRSNMGDETFFAALNRTGGADDPWAAISQVWDRASYDAALAAPRGDRRRDTLLTDLVRSHFPGYADLVARSGSGFVSIDDDGLGAISRHAHSLGYDAVVLFLDELILWLISNIADLAFVTREAQKIAKLVEGADARRPAPIVSFVARQRDLRELMTDDSVGRDRLAFLDTLKYWDGRFDRVELSDRNLPVIANKRLLQPKPGASGRELAEAFDQLKLRPAVRDVLMTNDADEKLFRLVYPFSPAFVTALIDVSAALQRERTALRVLLTLLVNQRDRLTIGDLVPLGELYDALDSADTPFTDELKASFAQARKLYETKLRPMLLQTGGITEDDAATNAAFQANDRLVKTLLLAALVPGSAAFKDLTLNRLVALNHGTIRTPIPGDEQRQVLARLKQWASANGEIRMGSDPQNPLVSIQLSSVDTKSILDKVQGHDSDSARRMKVRDAILDKIGLAPDQLRQEYTTVWRGVKHSVDLVFGNIRDRDDLPDDNLRAEGNRWKVLVDFPFDTASFGPADDLRRLHGLRDNGVHGRTVAWLPSFFTTRMQGDLGTLVILDHLLAGDNFARNAAHLSPADRESGRILLENQQSQLRNRLDHALLAAYRLEGGALDAIDADRGVEDHFPTLQPDVRVQPPVAADLREGLDKILDQVLAGTYPAAPKLGRSVPSRADLNKILDVCRRAVGETSGRVADLDAAMRRLMKDIAEPLKLGVQHDQAFVLDDHWVRHMARSEALWRKTAGPDAPLLVRVARTWFDEPEPMGLPVELSNLVLLVWAAKTNRRVLRHGGAIEERIETLVDEAELRAQPMPTDDEWDAAVDRAARLFGLVPATRVATAAAVAGLAKDLRSRAESVRNPLIDLLTELGTRCLEWDVPDSARVQTAEEARDVSSAIIAMGTDDLGVLRALGEVSLVSRPEVLSRTWTDAAPSLQAMRTTQWQIVENAASLGTDEAVALGEDVRTALRADQLAQPIVPALNTLVNRASSILARQSRPAPPSAAPTAASPGSAVGGGSTGVPVATGPQANAPVVATSVTPAARPGSSTTIHANLSVAEALKVLENLDDATTRVTLQIDEV